jgi:hypothetical protein
MRPAFLGAFGMTIGIEKARAFEQAGEHGAFGQREARLQEAVEEALAVC